MKKTTIGRIAATILLTLLSACAALPPADPALSTLRQEEALQQLNSGKLPLAITTYGEAIRYNPQNSEPYLLRAEIQEAIQQFSESAATYTMALKHLPPNNKARTKIHYRLGLLEARLKETRAARKHIDKLADTSQRMDLEGVISLHEGDADTALDLFNQALQATSNTEQRARIYYHASRAHYARGDSAESMNTLFHAVNNARSMALKQHISIFYDQIR